MDVLTLSRLQFAITSIYHFFFVPLTLTLGVMSIVALIFVPVVLAYQAWTYWIFRKRIVEKPDKLEY